LFFHLLKLEDLKLNDNDLYELPETIFDNLAKLTNLNLGSNDLHAIPKLIFYHLTKLQILNLTGNSLIEIPEGIFCGLTSLLDLDLSINRISFLPEPALWIGLRSLRFLSLSFNCLDNIDALHGLDYRGPRNNNDHIVIDVLSNEFTHGTIASFSQKFHDAHEIIHGLDFDPNEKPLSLTPSQHEIITMRLAGQLDITTRLLTAEQLPDIKILRIASKYEQNLSAFNQLLSNELDIPLTDDMREHISEHREVLVQQQMSLCYAFKQYAINTHTLDQFDINLINAVSMKL